MSAVYCISPLFWLSKQIPLGIQLLNENRLPEMAQIMEELQKYTPKLEREEPTEVGGKSVVLDKSSMLPLLLGGDQLTAARARGALSIRASHDRSEDRLEGLIPVVEDWHARLTFAKVSIYIQVSLGVIHRTFV